MISLDKCLAAYVSEGIVTLEAATEKSSHADELKRMCSESAPPRPKFATSF